MPTLHTPLLAQSVRLILNGQPGGNSAAHVFDYSDETVFRDLWLSGLESSNPIIAGSTLDWNLCDKPILIVGNDPPDGIFDTKVPSMAGINFSMHFTASSWLAAWKVKFSPTQQEKDEKKAVEANTRIAVIDPRLAGMAEGAAQALQTIFGASNANGQSLVPGAAVLNAPSLESICQWLKPTRPDSRTVTKDAPHLRDLLKSTIWSELTSNREHHHALSNVLGAFLLSIQVGQGAKHTGDPWVQDYLLAMVQALGVEASLDQVKLVDHGRFQRWITPGHQNEIEGIVLIDDMAALWSYFLRGASGFTGNAVCDTNSGRTYRESFEVFGREEFAKDISVLPGRLKAFFESRKPHLSAGDILGDDSKLTPERIDATRGLIVLKGQGRQSAVIEVAKCKDGGIRLHADSDGFEGGACVETFHEPLARALEARGVRYSLEERRRKQPRPVVDVGRIGHRIHVRCAN